MIRRLVDSDLDVLIRSGFVYVPLLFDPSVEQEILSPPDAGAIIQIGGSHFLKTLRLESLLDNYATVWPESYESLRHACLEEFVGRVPPKPVAVDGKLKMILFEVMPHFIRGHRGLERRRLGEEEILDWIESKVRIPAPCYQQAHGFLDTALLQRALDELEGRGFSPGPLTDGPISARRLGEWMSRAMECRIVEGEKARLRAALTPRNQSSEPESRHLAVLLHIAAEGSLEIDRFGFSRIGSGEDYLVYQRTGEYALKDYYGRPYLFPDCRVAVSTLAPLRPFVVDRYKHPFLEGQDSGQEICVGRSSSPGVFTAAAAIEALEAGIHALLYGYSGRRRNGYHGLDRVRRRAGSSDSNELAAIGPPDYPVTRRKPILDVDFEDYRVPSDHPKIASRQVAITNDVTP